jgi:hypothetical protein
MIVAVPAQTRADHLLAATPALKLWSHQQSHLLHLHHNQQHQTQYQTESSTKLQHHPALQTSHVPHPAHEIRLLMTSCHLCVAAVCHVFAQKPAKLAELVKLLKCLVCIFCC